MTPLEKIRSEIISCTRCPRLIHYCKKIATEKKREFRDWSYWGKPVSGFGDPRAKIWIVGLAPAAHGANRTGRMFTGDSSGNWLYRALFEVGLASQAESKADSDGLELKGAFISSAGRCAPPDNRPTLEELRQCEGFLKKEQGALKEVRVILALGAIAFKALTSLLEKAGEKMPYPKPSFEHGALYEFSQCKLLVSYHPSRQNTQTGRLTWEMWMTVFERAKRLMND